MSDCDDPQGEHLEYIKTMSKKTLQEEIEATKHQLRVVRARQYGDKRTLEEREKNLIEQLETLEERLKAMQWDKNGELI